MAVTLKTGGAWVEATADATATLVGTPVAGNRYFLFVSWKTYSITCQVTASSGNWTQIAAYADGTTASGTNTGSVKVACYYRDWVSGDVNPTIDFSSSPTVAEYCMQLWQKGAGDVWDTPVYQTAPWPLQQGPATVTGTSAAVAISNGAAVMCLFGVRDDSASATDLMTDITDAGVAFTGVFVSEPSSCKSSTTGDDMSADLGYRLVTTGAAAQTLGMAATLAASETGAVLWVIANLKVPPTISAISADPSYGGQTVTVTGTGFDVSTPTVSFGGAAATGVTVVNATSLTCIVPTYLADGAVNVTATNTNGTSSAYSFTCTTPAGVVFDSVAAGTSAYTTTQNPPTSLPASITWAHNAIRNTTVLVFGAMGANFGQNNSSAVSCRQVPANYTGVHCTYDGVEMAEVGRYSGGSANRTEGFLFAWKIANPPTGVKNIVMYNDATYPMNTLIGCSVGYSGVGSVVGLTPDYDISLNAPSATFSSAADRRVVCGMISGTAQSGWDQNPRTSLNINSNSAAGNLAVRDAAGAASVAFNAADNNDYWTMWALDLLPTLATQFFAML